MAANECLANVLSDALRIIMPHKGEDNNKGNAHNCNGRCVTVDNIIENEFHRLIVVNIIIFTTTV